MRRRLLLALSLVAVPLAAQTVLVTPSDLHGWLGTSYYAPTWDPGPATSGASASITSTFARSGLGSMELKLADEGLSEADWTYGLASPSSVVDLTTLSFDWYTASSSSTPAWTGPAFALAMSDGSFLIWEPAYNGYFPTAPTDQWVSSDVLGGNFWLSDSHGVTSCVSAAAYQSLALFNANCYGSNAEVAGLDIFLGGGYPGTTFDGAADNVAYGFNDADATVFNFEPDANASSVTPEPATMSLMALGMVGLVGARRRKGTRRPSATLSGKAGA